MASDTIKDTFTVTRHLQASNSFGTVAQGKDIELTVRMTYNEIKERGTFEASDKNGEWYMSGNLVITDGELVDYDGVYALSDFVMDWLQTQGVDVTDMRKTMSD